MKIEIDNKEKTIKLLEVVTFIELFNFMNDNKYNGYKIIPHTEIIKEEIYISPNITYPYPFPDPYRYDVICYTTEGEQLFKF